jgi:hypothetical protein
LTDYTSATHAQQRSKRDVGHSLDCDDRGRRERRRSCSDRCRCPHSDCAKAEPQQVFDKLVDIRELRILRALFGEPNGRLLDGYLTQYYKASLQAALEKGWIKQIEKRYYMTYEGARVCREYLRELAGWQPAAQLLG